MAISVNVFRGMVKDIKDFVAPVVPAVVSPLVGSIFHVCYVLCFRLGPVSLTRVVRPQRSCRSLPNNLETKGTFINESETPLGCFNVTCPSAGEITGAAEEAQR